MATGQPMQTLLKNQIDAHTRARGSQSARGSVWTRYLVLNGKMKSDWVGGDRAFMQVLGLLDALPRSPFARRRIAAFDGA